MHNPTDRIAHTTVFVTPVVEHWLEREIAPWVHPMKDRSDDPSRHERTLLSRRYISLLVTRSSNLPTASLWSLGLLEPTQERKEGIFNTTLLYLGGQIFQLQVLGLQASLSLHKKERKVYLTPHSCI